MAVEWVAGSSWNQWPDVHGMGGRMPVESALGVSRRQMPSVHKTVDIAFGFAPSFEQCLFRCAFVDVSSDELPPLFLTVPYGVIGKFRSIDQIVKIACAFGVFKADSRNGDN